ncbi:MAG: ISNCY family transposase [Gammaproteobacteria bacterium]
MQEEVSMTYRELDRLTVIKQTVISGNITQRKASEVLKVSERQVRRLQRRYVLGGPAGLVSKRRGRCSNRRLCEGLRKEAIHLIREHFYDYGPTLASEKLKEYFGIHISKETARQWMIAEGIWHPNIKPEPKIHPLRERWACFGELIQIDGSDHAWFEGRGPQCTLLVFIDDATSIITELFFTESETTLGYFEAFKQHVERYGVPCATYSDKHGVFKVNHPESKSGTGFRHRIADQSIIKLIDKWLKAGVMEDGKLTRASSGSPQGGVISPILANIYLHYVIDLWVTKVVRKHLQGEIYSYRYADDVLFCFQFRKDAIRFQNALRKRLEKFKLKLNSEKTKLCRFGKFAERDRKIRKEGRSTFNFLGFTFFNRISRNGKYTVGTRTQSKRLSGAMNRVTAWCKENRHQSVAWQARYLNAILRGHYNYYGVTGTFPSVAAFYRHCIKMWKRYLGKRSQRALLRWDKFMGILRDNPLIKPHLPHSVFNL